MPLPDWLVDARFRDWERRRRAGEPEPPAPEATEGEPLELQLVREIRASRDAAEASAGEDRERHLARARDLELRLSVLLERSGRPLAARALAESLRRGTSRG